MDIIVKKEWENLGKKSLEEGCKEGDRELDGGIFKGWYGEKRFGERGCLW